MRILTADGRELAGKAEAARGVVARFLGLMGRRTMPKGCALVLSPCDRIHTCLMRFPIDVVYADASLRVLRVDRAVSRWRILGACPGSRYVIELPAETVANVGLGIGDSLVMEDTSL